MRANEEEALVLVDNVQAFELWSNWLEQVDQKWIGRHGLVFTLAGFPNTVHKVLFEACFFTPGLLQEVMKLFDDQDSLSFCEGALMSSRVNKHNADEREFKVRRRISAQLFMHDFLTSRRMFGLEAIKVIAQIMFKGRVVGYTMPYIDSPAVTINSVPFLKEQVLLLGSHSGLFIDTIGKTAFELGHNSYMLIDAEFNSEIEA